MKRKRKSLKFLSKSVLLDESGLPMINTMIILVVSFIILLFIIWANTLVLHDVETITGYIADSPYEDFDYSFIGRIPAKDVLTFKTGTPFM